RLYRASWERCSIRRAHEREIGRSHREYARIPSGRALRRRPAPIRGHGRGGRVAERRAAGRAGAAHARAGRDRGPGGDPAAGHAGGSGAGYGAGLMRRRGPSGVAGRTPTGLRGEMVRRPRRRTGLEKGADARWAFRERGTGSCRARAPARPGSWLASGGCLKVPWSRLPITLARTPPGRRRSRGRSDVGATRRARYAATGIAGAPARSDDWMTDIAYRFAANGGQGSDAPGTEGRWWYGGSPSVRLAVSGGSASGAAPLARAWPDP